MEDTGRNSEKLIYAVVIFTCDNEEYISAAPKKWIDENEKSCIWPKKTLERKAINLQMKPENDWVKYTIVKVVGYYATLKEAVAVEKAKQCSSSSEPEEATLKRKITFNKRYRDDSLSPAPTLQTIQKATVEKSAAAGNEKHVSSDSESSEDTDTNHSLDKQIIATSM
ncbi:uncharacterized protein isoform X2 [Choristoneura fumiferana]|uniref:uncharacterized protein isoform X2 n=1 Tax=Choristoneura fumiferana TaxID=7141 RepID=UPI003D15AA8B